MASTLDKKEIYEMLADPRNVKETYFTQTSSFFEDIVTGVFSKVIKFFSSGDVKGGSLIVLCFGPYMFYPLPVCEYFNEITFACPDNKSAQEAQKWLKNEPDALDWSNAAKMICELQGCGETWSEKLQILQRKIIRVLKYDVTSGNPLSTAIRPQADCLILAHCVEHFVTDNKGYCEALKNVSSLQKIGGHLILIAVLQATFYMGGDFKCPLFYLDEDSLKAALLGAGYVILEDHIALRKNQCLYDITDYEYVAILKARKEREM